MRGYRLWRMLRIALLMFASVMFTACGGGGGGSGGGGGTTVANLQGTWFGAYQVGTSFLTIAVDVNANGQITDIRQNGTTLGVTGTLAHVQGNIFSFQLSDGTQGGFMTDSSAMHAGFLDENGSIGALQKGASALPVYASTDVVGSWSGYSLELDNSFNITATGSSTATVNSSFQITGTDMNGPFTGTIQTFSNGFGAYGGIWSNSSASGNLIAWISGDRSFAAAWACAGSVQFPVSIPDCSFGIWNK